MTLSWASSSLPNSIVIVTSIVVAATAAAVSERFDTFSRVGGIIGTSISAAFLIILGLMNLYILYKLVKQLKKLLASDESEDAAFKLEGAGCLMAVFRWAFKIVDRYAKMLRGTPLKNRQCHELMSIQTMEDVSSWRLIRSWI